MTKDAAVVVAVVCLALGWYFRKWLVAEDDAAGARQKAAAAGRAAWKARKAMLVAGFVAWAAFTAWTHGHGAR